MARAKVILVDADVIAHFIATGHIMELNGILSPHQLYVVENVYREATRHPGDANRKQKVDEMCIRDSVTPRYTAFMRIIAISEPRRSLLTCRSLTYRLASTASTAIPSLGLPMEARLHTSVSSKVVRMEHLGPFGTA